MTTPTTTLPALSGMLRINRGVLIAVSVIGIVLGILALALPSVSLLTVAIVFGSYLIASGIFRIVAAFAVTTTSVQHRWITGILGIVVVIAGVLCLADPFTSLFALAFLIGIGWIAEGAVDILAAVRGTISPRWFGWVSGALAVLAGIATFIIPGVALTVFVTVAAILLIVVSVSTLLMMPRGAAEKGAAATN